MADESVHFCYVAFQLLNIAVLSIGSLFVAGDLALKGSDPGEEVFLVCPEVAQGEGILSHPGFCLRIRHIKGIEVRLDIEGVSDLFIRFAGLKKKPEPAAKGDLQGAGRFPTDLLPQDMGAHGLPLERVKADVVKQDKPVIGYLVLPGQVIVADILIDVGAVNMQHIQASIGEGAKRLIKGGPHHLAGDIAVSPLEGLHKGAVHVLAVVALCVGIALPGVDGKKAGGKAVILDRLHEGKSRASIMAAKLSQGLRFKKDHKVIGKGAQPGPWRVSHQNRLIVIAGKMTLMIFPAVFHSISPDFGRSGR